MLSERLSARMHDLYWRIRSTALSTQARPATLRQRLEGTKGTGDTDNNHN